ncbi:AAA family ATPase [Mesonia maritima]|uniref:AAA family ATPase n=1 Tax=Mesonia maritima TaxID=1793873 RepID=UPI0036366649
MGKHKYNLYLLTYIDVPWEEDDLRDKPHEREEMFVHFKEILKQKNLPYVIINGTLEERLKKAVNVIDKLLKNENA